MKYRVWILFLGLVSLWAQANEPVSVDSRGYVEFYYIDSDHNGYVSRVEARSIQGVERSFDAADLDRDGLLNAREYKRAQVAAKRN